MTSRIVIEVVHRGASRTLHLHGVWRPYATQAGVGARLHHKIELPESVSALGEQELHELASAVECEIRGWAAKLPLGYA